MNARELSVTRRTPAPLAVMAALGLWGWQAEAWPWALAMGAAIEAARLARFRWDITQEDFNRLWNFTTLLFLGVALYLFLARQGLSSVGSLVTTGTPAGRLEGIRQISQTAVTFLRWLPFILFPFVLAHAWSRTPLLPWSTFSLYLRARAARVDGDNPASPARAPVHPAYPFLALVVFASAATTAHPVAYPPLMMAVVGWALWPWRNPRFRGPVWAALFIALLGGTLMAQVGLTALRDAWQSLEDRLAQRAGEGDRDLRNAFTALGAVGRLQQSARIVLRVRTEDDQAPGLLREAAFNRFRGTVWGSMHRDFEPVPAAIDGVLWRFTETRRTGRRLEIARYTTEGEAPLALPDEALALRDLGAALVETNYLAATRLREGPPLAIYTVEYGEGGGFDGPPEADDLDGRDLTEADRNAVREVAMELGLADRQPRAAIEAVRRYFATGFAYSLWQARAPASTNTTPLTSFLREWRAGHCEYFATATVLLLRAAGIPTRYAVGFSVDERHGENWLARGRDAHSWCLAFVDGRWLDVDTTPGVWREREFARSSWWQGIGDGFSQAWYRFALWRQQGGNWRLWVFAASVAALVWLGWRQIRGSRWRRAQSATSAARSRPPSPGSDSEFYAAARRWETTHGPRFGHETWLAWIGRLKLASVPEAGALREAVQLHYRLRFDPHGLAGPERERLRQLAADLVQPGSG